MWLDKNSLEFKILNSFESNKSLKTILFIVFMYFSDWVMTTQNDIMAALMLSTCFLMLIMSEDLTPQIWMRTEHPSGLTTLFKKPTHDWKYLIPFGISAFIALQMSVWLITGTQYEQNHLLETSSNGYIWGMVFTGPILEEITFRKMLYSEVLKPNVRYPMVISVLIFALVHFPTSLGSVVFYIGGSWILYYLYEKSNEDIRLSLIIHMLYNLIALI